MKIMVPNGQIRGKIYAQCGNEHIYNDSQIDNDNDEVIYHRHAEFCGDNQPRDPYEVTDIESALDKLPKLIGKSMIIFIEFDGNIENRINYYLG